MPNIQDATVADGNYYTRTNVRPQLLSNGWILTSVGDTINRQLKFYVSKDSGETFEFVGYKAGVTTTLDFFSVVVDGVNVHCVHTLGDAWVVHLSFNIEEYDGGDVTKLPSFKTNQLDTGQTTFNDISLAIQNNELYAAWSSKNAASPNSFNIRCAKGVIDTSGGVVWGSVELWTRLNSNPYGYVSPTTVVRDGELFVYVISTGMINTNDLVLRQMSTVVQLSKNVGTASPNHINVKFVNIHGYGVGTDQSSPSAIYTPPEINGLQQGRIWVAWAGIDSVDTIKQNIRTSYSDDGGLTFSPMQKLTSGNTSSDANSRPSITANTKNEIFILFQRYVDSRFDIGKLECVNSVWSSPKHYGKNSLNAGPTALYNPNVNFSEPIFVYNDSSRVGFYGTWAVVKISVSEGSIGVKTSKDNFFSYHIMTEDVMYPIVEKINNVVINTRDTAVSGQEFIITLTDEQWEKVNYGDLNTLIIEMGSSKWEYTFGKRIPTDGSFEDVEKAVLQVNDNINTKKAELATAINNKGGSVVDNPTFNDLLAGVGGIITGKRFARGGGTVSATARGFKSGTGSGLTLYSLEVSDLEFEPSFVFILSKEATASQNYSWLTVFNRDSALVKNTPSVAIFVGQVPSQSATNTYYGVQLDGVQAFINNTGFRLPTMSPSGICEWFAIE